MVQLTKNDIKYQEKNIGKNFKRMIRARNRYYDDSFLEMTGEKAKINWKSAIRQSVVLVLVISFIIIMISFALS